LRNAFFILGRPRSRTAWLANLLTVTPFSFCLHEGLADFGGSLNLLERKMRDARAIKIGNADTGLIHYADELVERFPDSSFVLIAGTQRSWHLFASKMGIADELRDAIDHAFVEAGHVLSNHPNALILEAHELDDVRSVEELWAHCLGTTKSFDRARFEMLRGFNVQADNAVLLERIRRGSPYL